MARGDRATSWLPHVIFYGLQAVLATAAGVIIFTDADPRVGMYQLQQDTNIVGDNPGLSFRPAAIDESGTLNSVISYRISDRNGYRPWVDSLVKFLEVYKLPGRTNGRIENIFNCDYDNPARPGGVCDVDIRSFGVCNEQNLFNYHRGAPCVFLKLNTPRGWQPEFYNNSNSLPDEMPPNLKAYISDLARTDPVKLNTVWVSCAGEHPADVEFMGPIEIFPRLGFPGYYFRTAENEGYLSPLVAVHFERPQTGPLINIKCKAWARNIRHDNDTALGGVRFGLMLE